MIGNLLLAIRELYVKDILGAHFLLYHRFSQNEIRTTILLRSESLNHSADINMNFAMGVHEAKPRQAVFSHGGPKVGLQSIQARK